VENDIGKGYSLVTLVLQGCHTLKFGVVQWKWREIGTGCWTWNKSLGMLTQIILIPFYLTLLS
jgi:hypothetical protein